MSIPVTNLDVPDTSLRDRILAFLADTTLAYDVMEIAAGVFDLRVGTEGLGPYLLGFPVSEPHVYALLRTELDAMVGENLLRAGNYRGRDYFARLP